MGAVRLLLGSAVAALTVGCIPYPTWHWEAVPTDQYNLSSTDDGAIKVNDRVRARSKKTGKTYEFKVSKLEKDGFWGAAKDNKLYKTFYDDVGLLQVETEELHGLFVNPLGGASAGPILPGDRWRDSTAVPTDQYNLAAGSDDAIRVGDVVSARSKDSGKTYRFLVKGLAKDGFLGLGDDNKQYKILYDQLGLLEVKGVHVHYDPFRY